MPQVVGFAVLTAVGITATPTIATIVGSVIIAAGSLALQMLLQREQQAAPLPQPQNGRQSTRQPIPPRRVVFGRCRVGGSYMLYEERGGHSYDNLAHCEGPIVGVVSYYLHDDKVGVDEDGWVNDIEESTSSGQKIDGRYGHLTADTVRIQTRLGQFPQTAETSLVETFPDIWSANHRGDGICNSTLICKAVTQQQFEHVYPHGLPQLSVVLDGLPCWDPRDPAQDRLDETTWEISYNPIIQFIRFVTDEHIGLGHSYEDVIEPILDHYIREADLCDVEGYTSNGFYYLDTDPSEVITMLMATCDGWHAEDGEGRIVPWVGSYRAPTVTIEEKHIRGFSVRLLGNEDEHEVDQLDFSYTSPGHDYNEVDGDPWIDEEAVAARGVPRVKRIPLTWVQSHDQARKVAKFAFSRLRAAARGEFTLDLTFGLTILGQRWLALEWPFIDMLNGAVIEVAGASIDIGSAAVRIEWILVEPGEISTYDPETEGGTEPIEPVAPVTAELWDSTGSSIIEDGGQPILVV